MADPRSQLKKEKAIQIIKHLHQEGYKAYLVGGCVRDMALGLTSMDFDIATSAHPETIVSLFPRTVQVGAQFGVILVMNGEDCFEVSTFRSDDAYIDGRRPISVRFVSEQEDVTRRDFTMNGLLYDIVSDRIIDYVGGLNDIQSKIIRTIGEPKQRFWEDKLRLMRAIRFSARFNFNISSETKEALISQSSQIVQISRERIRDELSKMLLGPTPQHAIEMLHDYGLLKHILPDVENMAGIQQPNEFHPEGDVFSHTLKALKLFDQEKNIPPSETLMFSLLFHDIGKPATFHQADDRIRFHNHHLVGRKMTYRIMESLRFPKQITADVCHCVENHMNFINVPHMRKNTLKRFIRHPLFNTEMELHRLDCLASHGNLSIYNLLLEKLEELSSEPMFPQALISGKRLIELGYKPGPIFKKIMLSVEDLQLLNQIVSKEEAENFVKKRFPIN